MPKYPPLQYHQYLELDAVLNAQKPRSREYGSEAHDETLFIIIHQVYELWFKQLLHELDSILKILTRPELPDHEMGQVVHRLDRMNEIFKLLIAQIHVLETMTPLDFLDFRDMLFPASGFQSFQFRQLEARLGLKSSQRLAFNSKPYTAALSPDQAQAMMDLEKQPTLAASVERWLERTPFLNVADFDFWQNYRRAVDEMFQRDADFVSQHAGLNASDRDRNLNIIEQSKAAFASLFEEATFNQAKAEGRWNLSFKALHAALFIQVYREQPVLQQPFALLTALIDLDENMTNWRYRHALMAKRMLGTKIGTGGSSGFEYLRATTEQHRLFGDLNQLTTFFISRSQLPDLPESMKKKLGFQYSAR